MAPGRLGRVFALPILGRQLVNVCVTIGLDELVRLYAIRNSIGPRYKQVKDELGWAEFQVGSDACDPPPLALVNCAFSFRLEPDCAVLSSDP